MKSADRRRKVATCGDRSRPAGLPRGVRRLGGLDVLVIETSAPEAGGSSSKIENYLGFRRHFREGARGTRAGAGAEVGAEYRSQQRRALAMRATAV